MTSDDDMRVRHGTHNIFADLGFPDAETHLLKAGLVSRMGSVIKERKLTQSAIARLTGMSQPDVSRLLRGQFRDVSVERILTMLTRLGCEIDITVRAPAGGSSEAAIQLRPVAA